MKKIVCSLIFLLLLVSRISAQAPGKFNYQAVARNSSGNLILNQNISVRISILTGSTIGASEYSETHSVATDAYGVFNLLIGNGTPVSGSFDGITWGTASKFLKIEADVTGATSYQTLATTQILSMPYALYANKAGNGFSGSYTDLTNKPALSVSSDTVKLTGGSYGILPKTFNDNQFEINNAGGIADNPISAPTVMLAGLNAGNVENGTYDYKITFITSAGETGPGPVSSSVTVTNNLSNGQILVSGIPVSGKTNVNARNVYRRFNAAGDFLLVTTLNDNSTTTYIDNIANSSLGKLLSSINSTYTAVQFDASLLTQKRTYQFPDKSGYILLENYNNRILAFYTGSDFNAAINSTNSYEFPAISASDLFDKIYIIVSITIASGSYGSHVYSANSGIKMESKPVGGIYSTDYSMGTSSTSSNSGYGETFSGVGQTLLFPHLLSQDEKNNGIIIKITGAAWGGSGAYISNINTFIYGTQ